MKVGDFCKTGAGGTPLKSNRRFYEGGTIPWLLSGEVGNRDITETKKFITQEGLDGSSAKMFPVNTVLIAMYGATAGEVGILRCDASTNQAVCGILPNEKVLPEYLYYFFLNHKDLLIAQAVGNAQPNISQLKIKNTEIPLPPIPEQKRIVALLDTVFADLEQTRAKTEQNLKNARELFESYLQQVFSQKGEGWESIPLGGIADLVDSLHTTPKYIDEGGFPMVRVTEIKKSGLSLKKAKRVDQETYEKFSKRHKSCVGDIILSRVGASYGIPVIVETDEVFCLGQNTVFILPKINSYWLYYFLLSPVAKEQIDSFVAGSAQPTVSMKSIRQLIVPIPSKLEQDRIEPEIKKVLSQSNQLIDIYRKKLSSIDELKKSILQKAFNGE